MPVENQNGIKLLMRPVAKLCIFLSPVTLLYIYITRSMYLAFFIFVAGVSRGCDFEMLNFKCNDNFKEYYSLN